MKPRVLLANADEPLVAAWRDCLTGFGFAVEAAGGGVECLAKLHRFVPDVLVLDLGLPWGGADGVLARMREELGLRSIPVVLLAGDTAADEPASFTAAPVVRLLRKPVALARIVASVRLATAPPHPRRAGDAA